MCSHLGPSMGSSDQTCRKPHSAVMSGSPLGIISLTCNQTYSWYTDDSICSKKFSALNGWDYSLSMLNCKFYENEFLSSSFCPWGAYPCKRSTEGWIHSSSKHNTSNVQQAVENPEMCQGLNLLKRSLQASEGDQTSVKHWMESQCGKLVCAKRGGPAKSSEQG